MLYFDFIFCLLRCLKHINTVNMIIETTSNKTTQTASIITHSWTPLSLSVFCFRSEVVLLVGNSTESVVSLSVIVVAVTLSESSDNDDDDGSRVCVGEEVVVMISVVLHLCAVEVVNDS